MNEPWVPLAYRIGRGLDGVIRATRTEVRSLAECAPAAVRRGGEEGDACSSHALARVLLADYFGCSPDAPIVCALQSQFVERWLQPLALDWGQRTEISGPQLDEWLRDLSAAWRTAEQSRPGSGESSAESGAGEELPGSPLGLAPETSASARTRGVRSEHPAERESLA